MGLWKLERLDPFVYISVTLAALTFSTGAMCRISPMQGTSNRNLHADFVAGHENGPGPNPTEQHPDFRSLVALQMLCKLPTGELPMHSWLMTRLEQATFRIPNLECN
jgi:hypothetical protein